jgi:hypothetical protein
MPGFMASETIPAVSDVLISSFERYLAWYWVTIISAAEALTSARKVRKSPTSSASQNKTLDP